MVQYPVVGSIYLCQVVCVLYIDVPFLFHCVVGSGTCSRRLALYPPLLSLANNHKQPLSFQCTHLKDNSECNTMPHCYLSGVYTGN